MNPDILQQFEHLNIGHLTLRIPTLEDAEAVYAIHGDPATNRYNPAGPMSDPSQAIEKLKLWRQDWLVEGYGYWSVVDPIQSEVIGIGGVRLLSFGDREILNLYYRFAPKSWGHGYATDIARVAVQMARRHLPEWPVVARVRPTNTPSIRVAQKAGLMHRPNLDTTDHLVFTTDWTDKV